MNNQELTELLTRIGKQNDAGEDMQMVIVRCEHEDRANDVVISDISEGECRINGQNDRRFTIEEATRELMVADKIIRVDVEYE